MSKMTRSLNQRTFTKMCQHLAHCAALLLLILIFVYPAYYYKQEKLGENFSVWNYLLNEYGLVATSFLYFIQLPILLGTPLAIFNFLGLILYNGFPDHPYISKSSIVSTPFICFRTVTKGDYPQLVQNNVQRNKNICFAAGLNRFVIEVVTDKSINLVSESNQREVVVPNDYKTLSGALFKARALQYCLENGVNELGNDDWIVHLDEETILTEACVNGIINFIHEGKHAFGQGLITYTNDGIGNWLTSMLDMHRVADDAGKVQFQLKVARAPILGWKGSYVVSKAAAERDVSYDNGPKSSLAEDAFFGLLAASKGYSFGFIEGIMWEKSPFTMMDLIKQRKRWIQGLLQVTHSSRIPLRYRILFGCTVYSVALAPFSFCNFIIHSFYSIPMNTSVNIMGSFVGAVAIYMGIYGILRSFDVREIGWFKFLFLIVAQFALIPIKVVIELVAIVWGLCSSKNHFFVVNKYMLESTNGRVFPI